MFGTNRLLCPSNSDPEAFTTNEEAEIFRQAHLQSNMYDALNSAFGAERAFLIESEGNSIKAHFSKKPVDPENPRPASLKVDLCNELGEILRIPNSKVILVDDTLEFKPLVLERGHDFVHATEDLKHLAVLVNQLVPEDTIEIYLAKKMGTSDEEAAESFKMLLSTFKPLSHNRI